MLVVDIVHGVLAYRIYDESTTADVFDNFLANEFMAVAGRGRYVMCDNLAAHFTDGKAAAGHRLIARPAYSPDMAPIESCFSKLKAFLRRHSDNINAANFKFAVEAAILSINVEDVRGYYQNTYYSVPGREYRPYLGMYPPSFDDNNELEYDHQYIKDHGDDQVPE